MLTSSFGAHRLINEGPAMLCLVVSDSLQSRGLECQAPLSMGILQVRILEWVAMPSSKGSS